MLWQKSRFKWIVEGDANSSYFHGRLNSRRRENEILCLAADGQRVEEVQELRGVVKYHFSNHFTARLGGSPYIIDLSFLQISAPHNGC